MHVTILGKRYRFEWFRRRNKHADHGYCDDPAQKNKSIRIAQNQGDFDKLDTIIHEVLHAADWHKSEEWVGTVGTDLARILWRLGYRRSNDGQNSK